MSSEDSHPYQSRQPLKALPLQMEKENIHDQNLSGGSAQREALNPEAKEFKAGRTLRSLASMLAAGEDEI